MFLDYFALGMVVFVTVFMFYAIIAIHDIPYEISKHRNHPHQDAIHVAGWVSLFTLHILWPFLWIWSTLYREDRGWGFNIEPKINRDKDNEKDEGLELRIDELLIQVESLEAKLAERGTKPSATPKASFQNDLEV